MPARADDISRGEDNPQDPYQRSLRMSLGETARADRCRLGNILHYTGPTLRTVVSAKLAGPDSAIHEALTSNSGWGGEELYTAQSKDDETGYNYKTTFYRRQDKLNQDNKPYASTNSSAGRPWNAPAFGADIVAFTELGRGWSVPHLWDNPTPRPGAAAMAKAKEVYDAFDTKGDDWATKYKERAGSGEMDGLGTTAGNPGSANDIATFLRFGGFATKAPEPDSPEFRTEVEFLKAAWASCDSQNPIDHYRVLTGVTTQAYTEWEAEYASQATQRNEIVTAEAAASKEARTNADLMIEAIRQSWQADQILFWQQWFRDHPDAWNKPSLTDQKNASRRLVTARETTAQLVKDADAAVARAKTASEQAAASQQAAYAIADQNKVPRGRGLLYAQQAAQVAKASYAAAQAAAKTVLTASKATQANMADSQALYALTQTQSHALNTEFRKAAALEAAAQAKAAADSAEKLAKEAAGNATTAKNAQATAEKAEKTAQAGAAEAKKQRGIAEAEKANAEREAATAASERKKAGEAEARTQTERDAAGRARTSAEAAGATASDKRKEAEAAEARAFTARNKALQAEKEQKAQEARAAALEAAADAAESEGAAGGARQAATEARTAANDAVTAATAARAAANDASTAAVNARAAATRAQAAASRAKAAADASWSAFQKTTAAAATAHAAAAKAIDAAAAAKAKAEQADAEAKKAQAAAKKAREEADAAKDEAAKTSAWSAKTSGFAQAAALAAQGARDSATAVTKAADEAISIGSPYQELDTSAAFAVLIGQNSKTLAEQQASAAEAKSKEAAKAAVDAKALADKAAGDAKIAAQAAATAAADAARAVKAAEAARASAAEADKAAKAAQKADDNAQKYAAEAGTDAYYAGMAANDAQTAANDADRDATDAEKDAASADAAATAAETDAASADATATKAEGDATAAETAAKNADGAAKDADTAATRTENAEARKTIDTGGATGVAHMFTTQKIDPMEDPKPLNDCVLGMGNSGCDVKFRLHFKLTLDFFLCTDPGAPDDVDAATCPGDSIVWLGRDTKEHTAEVTKHFSNWDITKIFDKAILKALWDGLTQDFVDCAKGSIGGCALAATWFIPPSKITQAVDLIRALDGALQTGIGVGDAYKALKALGLDAEVMANIERETMIVEDALTSCTRNSFPGDTQVLMADGAHRAISSLTIGDLVLTADPETGDRRAEPVGSTFKHETDRLVDVAFADGTSLTSTAGHRVYVAERGWTLVSDLRRADRLRGPEGDLHTVIGLDDRTGIAPRTVYDLTVDHLHTFFVSTEGEGSKDVLVHNCMNLQLHEDDRGAHTIKDHVNIDDERAFNKAMDEYKAGRQGVTGVWTSLDVAQGAVDEAMKKWLTGGTPKQNMANQKKLKNWMAKTAKDSNSPLELFPIKIDIGGSSLGKVFSYDRTSRAAGSTVAITLKRTPHKPGYMVYTSYPI
ncbi:polymorphic toxin-type HINT domain-containing protein [Streptomyces sp. TLI_146]|uniref:polymorphic toxin-type HINT domain-containing protein n=1 Tax=Streptomyces sp. TLI_146 TaxID=1938858 RepID=UPI000C70327F|nr:polymorphic toxin-type HINT domain-containing protein [Streptomyces sp. TLI_146]PKV82807.1 intein/intein [Streptomyces sp. TLI_146]